MFANSTARGARRRGIVLVLILGMLGLLALIGVTFATFAGQSLVNARNFSLSEGRTGPEQYFDFALGQLINDSNNPLSALRGHSLLRDMYGNDSTHRGTTAADIRGHLDGVVNSGVASPLRFTAFRAYPNAENKNSPYLGLFQFRTNIPTGQLNYQYFGLNFTRWILRVASPPTSNAASTTSYPAAAQTFEVLEDDDRGTDKFSNGYHVLTLSVPDPFLTVLPARTSDPNRFYKPPTGIYINTTVDTSTSPFTPEPGAPVGLTPTFLLDTNGDPTFPNPFLLDGRYMRAFNGPGMNRSLLSAAQSTTGGGARPLVPFNVAAYANFRANQALINPTFPLNYETGNVAFPTAPALGDPDAIGMDEDYDACDLENWFLAIQSADGQVVIPSFHRPGILTRENWTARLDAPTAAELKGAVAGVAKILRPRRVDHSPQFPDDPIPDASGKIKYDIDNDGDGVTDSVWLDLGYPVQRDAGGKMFKPLFAFMVIGQNGRMPLNTAGNLQARDFQTVQNYATTEDPPGTKLYAKPRTFYDAPTWDHASHLGNSVNEVNPKYALQNAPANAYSPNVAGQPTVVPATVGDLQWSQVDNAGIDVALTQLRNLLAGTIPQDKPVSPTVVTASPFELLNHDQNFVAVGGQPYYMPNNVIDAGDFGYNAMNPNQSTIDRTRVAAVPGRFGESEGIPQLLNYSTGIFATFTNTRDIYTNPVRAGRSIYGYAGQVPENSYTPTADALDDDYDSFNQVTSALAEYTQPVRDGVGQFAIPSHRLQRFVTPTDPSGAGRLVGFMNRPNEASDFGNGYDNLGRVGFFRYFRPPGVAADITYPIPSRPTTTPSMAGDLDAFRQVVFLHGGSLGIPNIPNRTNNLYHGYEGFRAPITNQAGPYSNAGEAIKIAVMGAMPYDRYERPIAATPTIMAVVGDPSQSHPNLGDTYNFTTPTESGFVNSGSGPYLFGNPPPPFPPTIAGEPPVLPYMNQAANPTVPDARVVNGYPMGSLNKDEADEMNLYTPNRDDMPFGPSDLEWLYRKQDVDGSTLNSRLAKLAPVSFLNAKDGQMRRRFFSVDSWEPNSFVYANDNPQGAFRWNSRFGQLASASLALTNQVVADPRSTGSTIHDEWFANAFAVEGLNNPTLPIPINSYTPNPSATTQAVPLALKGSTTATYDDVFDNAFVNSSPVTQSSGDTQVYPRLHSDAFARPNPAANTPATPTLTPSVAHRDRRINLNFPLPVASDPAEPVRQKWIRETYQLLKATLPPQAVDTPQELAALSQYVVNIIDFRDPDATMTRFVNTDLMVVPATATAPSNVKFADRVVPTLTDEEPDWDQNNPKAKISFGTPFDPNIALEQTNPSTTPDWNLAMDNNAFVVQYGMEYNPIALNEVLCYSFNKINGSTDQVTRMYVELVNTLTDDTSHDPTLASVPQSAEALNLAGWDLVMMEDNALGRPDPITGCLTPNVGRVAGQAPPAYTGSPTKTAATLNPGNMAGFPASAIGWSFADGLIADYTRPNDVNNAKPVPPIQATSGNSTPTYYVMANQPPPATDDPIPVRNNPESRMPANFPPTIGATKRTPAAGTGSFYWLYLRRPANPFNPSGEMVVVDAMRFAWVADDGTSKLDSGGKPITDKASTTQLYSSQRPQPYRGGQLVPAPFPNPPFAYGYTNQASGNHSGNGVGVHRVGTGPPPANNDHEVTKKIYETIGAEPANKDSWDHFPFHDRDFTSVAELLLVPGCPPGLFTKQFAEVAFRPNRATGTPLANTDLGAGKAAPARTAPFAAGTPNAFPYLPDKFYYTAASVAPDLNPVVANLPYPNQVGGWTGTGWHKMFDFFEVPSSANGAIGTADGGENFDWARADRKPGLINLNLIVDEEVFFGLIDDPRLNINLARANTAFVVPDVVTEVDDLGHPASSYSFSDPDASSVTTLSPGTPVANSDRYPLGNQPGAAVRNGIGRGFAYGDPAFSGLGANQNTIHGMKAAFADFLMLRHGGSPYLFGHGAGLVEDGNADYVANVKRTPANHAPENSIPADRFFHSLSYPDINYTIMRPAYLPPMPVTPKTPTMPVVSKYTTDPADPSTLPNAADYLFTYLRAGATNHELNVPTTKLAFDPGLRYPYIDRNYSTDPTSATTPAVPEIPPIPPRRLFQIPDQYVGALDGTAGIPSNASLVGDTANNATITDQSNAINADQYLAYQKPFTNSTNGATVLGGNSLVAYEEQVVAAPYPTNEKGTPAYLPRKYYLGSGGNNDNRQHPAYRTEMLQKVMNLTTVRTHQFAVWITVGFFEVTRVGTPELGVPDALGGELAAAAGANVRYRSFFVIDRTRATGFDPYYPGDFRDCVTYRRRIE